MNKKSIILGIATVLTAAGFVLCIRGFMAWFSVYKDGPPWFTQGGLVLFGISFILFIVGAFTSE